jgi:hypothetical protein
MNKNNAFSIEVSSDLDYEDIVANILYREETFAILSQDKGLDNLEIKILPYNNEDLFFPLNEFFNIIESAKKILIRMQKMPEE